MASDITKIICKFIRIYQINEVVDASSTSVEQNHTKQDIKTISNVVAATMVLEHH